MSASAEHPFKTIVVGYDGTDHARDALAFAGTLATAMQAKVIAATVFEIPPAVRADPSWIDEPVADAKQTADDAASQDLVDSSLLETMVVQAGSAPRGLHALAEERDADLIVAGSAHGTSIGQVVPGSVGRRLLHGAHCAVAVTPAGYASKDDHAIEEIVVGFDGSDEAMHALDGAIFLSEATGARITLVAVAEQPSVVFGKGGGAAGIRQLAEAITEERREQLEAGMARTGDGQKIDGSVVHGDPAEALREAAADADLLMIGSRAYGPMRTVLLGSVAGKLVHSAPCPVLVYPRGAESPKQGAPLAGATADGSA
jgi:nucleotide-binding universal stress UspA family protein